MIVRIAATTVRFNSILKRLIIPQQISASCTNAKTPARAGISYNGYIPNNLTIYAIEASLVYSTSAPFFQNLVNKCPQFLSTVKACFVVDEDCLTFDTSIEVEIAGYTFKRCVYRAYFSFD